MLTDLITATLGELLADILGTDIRRFRAERAMQRAITTAVQRAETRFPAEYPAQDAALIAALTAQPDFFAQPAVKAALHELLRFPFRDPAQRHAVVQQSFHDLLPQETDRARVDAAVTVTLPISLSKRQGYG